MKKTKYKERRSFMSKIVTNRHDILILFDVTNGNPNGDPDAGNMPRIDPTTNRGLVSDVCLKRKIRNHIESFKSKEENGRGYEIMIHQGAVINQIVNEAKEPASRKADLTKEKDTWQAAALEYLCNRFFDLRAFGAVISTGNEIFKGSTYGQVRGPIQFTFGRSINPITPLDISITRCAVADEKEKKAVEASADRGSGENRTMGNKHIVPYALYVAKAYISPVFAEKTGFTDEDLNLFFEALQNMFTHDQSAARAEMTVRGIYDFEHVGTQDQNNAEQNRREARLGCYHAHKLFEGISVRLKPGKDYPESFDDYKDHIVCSWAENTLPKGVILHFRHEQPVISMRFKA
jgi:CRISPR-associated protein Csd2